MSNCKKTIIHALLDFAMLIELKRVVELISI